MATIVKLNKQESSVGLNDLCWCVARKCDFFPNRWDSYDMSKLQVSEEIYNCQMPRTGNGVSIATAKALFEKFGPKINKSLKPWTARVDDGFVVRQPEPEPAEEATEEKAEEEKKISEPVAEVDPPRVWTFGLHQIGYDPIIPESKKISIRL